MQIYAYDIEKLASSDLETSFVSKSKYKPTKFSEAGRHVMEIVHGIPNLLEGVSLGEVVIYIGRSYYNPLAPSQGVYGRFKEHFKSKGLKYGIVALSCNTETVALWEKAAIRLIKHLKDNKKLCVSDIINESSGANGKAPSQDESVIYIAWSTGKKTRIQYPTSTQIDKLARRIFDDVDREIPLPQIKNVLLVTANTDQALDIAWGNDLESLDDDFDFLDDDLDYECDFCSIGELTVKTARACGEGVEKVIRKVTGLSVAKIRKTLLALPGNTRVRNAFLEDWPDCDSDDEGEWNSDTELDDEVEYLGGLTVSYCIRNECEKDIARITRLPVKEVRETLNNTHGNSKVMYVFDEWPWLED